MGCKKCERNKPAAAPIRRNVTTVLQHAEPLSVERRLLEQKRREQILKALKKP